MESFLKRLNDFGFEKGRRALAALALSFFISLYLLVSFNSPPGWGPAFLALSACYLVAFLAVTADWFWGRWFASGLGWSGMMVAVLSLVMIGWTPPLAIYGGLHGIVVLALLGKKMAAQYDMQEAWRQRYGMDEFGVARLRKTVTRAAASLPSLILWALGPKEGQGESLLLTAAGIGTLLTAALALRHLIQLRTAGWIMLAGACVSLWLLGSTPASLTFSVPSLHLLGPVAYAPALVGVPLFLATMFLTMATLPFSLPVLRFLTRRQ
jgi:hypothetical protein